MQILTPFRTAVALICCLSVPAYPQGPGAGDPSIVWDQVVTRAWTEPDFKAKLLRDPHAALAEHGFKVRDGTNVRVVENTADTEHLVLPAPPKNARQMSAEDLGRAAAERAATAGRPSFTKN